MTDPKEAYADAVKHLASHFERGSCLISERADFTRRVLLSSENVVRFITTLRELAAKCAFIAAQLEKRGRD